MSEAFRPSYRRITVTCRCGHHFETRSAVGEDFAIEICSRCHPVFGAHGRMTTLQAEGAHVDETPGTTNEWSRGLTTFTHVTVEQ